MKVRSLLNVSTDDNIGVNMKPKEYIYAELMRNSMLKLLDCYLKKKKKTLLAIIGVLGLRSKASQKPKGCSESRSNH